MLRIKPFMQTTMEEEEEELHTGMMKEDEMDPGRVRENMVKEEMTDGMIKAEDMIIDEVMIEMDLI